MNAYFMVLMVLCTLPTSVEVGEFTFDTFKVGSPSLLVVFPEAGEEEPQFLLLLQLQILDEAGQLRQLFLPLRLDLFPGGGFLAGGGAGQLLLPFLA